MPSSDLDRVRRAEAAAFGVAARPFAADHLRARVTTGTVRLRRDFGDRGARGVRLDQPLMNEAEA